MTNNQVLQKFAAAVDAAALRADFPDIEWVITQLEDGQQEIIIRIQGADPDFSPAADIAVIEAVKMADIPNPVKNTFTLDHHKEKLRNARLVQRDLALLKRIRVLISPAGVSLKKLAKIIRRNLPDVEIEI